MDCCGVIVLIGGTAGPVNMKVRVHVYLDLKKNTACLKCTHLSVADPGAMGEGGL